MKALLFSFNMFRFAAAKLLGSINKGGYLSFFSPLQLKNIPKPRLLGDGWVIIKTHYAGICGSDLKQVYLEGAMDNPITSLISFPHVPGHEATGTIVETGSKVKDFKSGDRVLTNPWLGCAARGLPLCQACRKGLPPFCNHFTEGKLAPGLHQGNCKDVSGSFAPYMPAHQSMCHKIPESVTFEEAILADPFSVSLHAICKAPPKPGETVLVIGCGSLGMLLIHILSKLYPGVKILALDICSWMKDQALSMGATQFLSYPAESVIQEIASITKNKVLYPKTGLPWILDGIDKIYDTVSSAKTIELGLKILKRQGVIVLVGVDIPRRFEWTPLYFKEAMMVGSNAFGIEDFEGEKMNGFDIYLKLLKEKRVDTASIITHKFNLKDYKKAFKTAKKKNQYQSIKVLFDFQD